MRPSVNEQLAVLTALQKLVKQRLDAVRAEADAALVGDYDADGVTKKALKLGSAKVGEYLVVLSPASWAVSDPELFEDFALAYGFASARKSIKPERMHQALAILEREDESLLEVEVAVDPGWRKLITNTAGVPTLLDSGEVVPGIELVPESIKCTQVRGCKPEDVIPIMQQLGGVEHLLLGTGPEDN